MYVAKIGDVVDGNGIIIGPGHLNVRINGIPLARYGDAITPHSCCGVPGCEAHCAATLLPGSRKLNIKVNGETIIVQSDFATCFDVITIPRPIFNVIAL